MSKSHKRVFSAERRMRAEKGLPEESWSDDFFDPTAAAPGHAPAGTPMDQVATASADPVTNTQLMTEIRVLRAELARLRDQGGGTPVGGGPEIELIRQQIVEMNSHIQQAKVQIAALRHPKAEDDRLVAAASELDAIVKDTEMATHDILESAEAVDDLAMAVKNAASDDFVRQNAEQIGFIVTKIFESCNFQDITGQRINKVVQTLQFIEDRVHNMISIWGPEAFEDLPLPDEVPDTADTDLLNGPQLDGEGISQDDIDKLFD